MHACFHKDFNSYQYWFILIYHDIFYRYIDTPNVESMIALMSSVWDMILQWGSTIKVSIELPATTRHRRNMTEKLLKATLNPNKHTHIKPPYPKRFLALLENTPFSSESHHFLIIQQWKGEKKRIIFPSTYPNNIFRVGVQQTNEPPRDKTNKMTVRPVKTQISYPLSTQQRLWSTLPRLIWVFAGHTVILLVLSRGGSNNFLRMTLVAQTSSACKGKFR